MQLCLLSKKIPDLQLPAVGVIECLNPSYSQLESKLIYKTHFILFLLPLKLLNLLRFLCIFLATLWIVTN